jgi:hypothetical protein
MIHRFVTIVDRARIAKWYAMNLDEIGVVVIGHNEGDRMINFLTSIKFEAIGIMILF